MSRTQMAPDPQRLLAHGEALHRLASALDSDAADDLVQDTWLRTLGRTTESAGPTRAWLQGVLRNTWRMDRRARARRVRREQAAKLAPTPFSTPELAYHEHARRQHLAVLLGHLPEHLRTVVELRYLHELSAAEIARRQGIPPGTVRRRLKEALDRIRAADTDRLRSLAVVALPEAAGTSMLPHVAAEGLLAMKLSTKVLAAVLVALTGLVGGATLVATGVVTLGTLESEQASSDSDRVRQPEEDHGIGDAAKQAELEATGKGIESREAARLHRDELLERIRRARNLKRSDPSTTPSAAVEGTGLDREYIREVIRDQLIPQARYCYNRMLVVDPEYGGTVVLDFTIVADEELGGVVEQVELGDGTDIDDVRMQDCLQEAMYGVTFDPPKEGGSVNVSYPLTFEPG